MKDIISVIVPVYNVEKYLDRCLKSIISQTYTNLEIICVNDGSTDKSLSILEKYEKTDKRIKIISKPNGGLSSARNTGLKYATGSYVSFIDSDDEIKANTYERVMSVFSKDIDVVFFGTEVRYEAHEELAKSDAGYYSIKFSGKCKITDDILLSSDCSAWNKVYRREKLSASMVTFPEGMYYEDFPFYWNIMSILKNIYFLNERLYIYYRRGSSIMSGTFEKKDNTAIKHIFVLDTIYDYWIKNNIMQSRELVFEKLCLNCFWFAMINSPDFEKARCIWEMTKRLRMWKIHPEDGILNSIMSGNYHIQFLEEDHSPSCQQRVVKPLKSLEKLFCIRNEGNHKVLRLLGMKIASKRRKY